QRRGFISCSNQLGLPCTVGLVKPKSRMRCHPYQTSSATLKESSDHRGVENGQERKMKATTFCSRNQSSLAPGGSFELPGEHDTRYPAIYDY
ncbi:hypothetical protein J6590_062331, partial [Homalodisca vitripennis]